MTDPNGSKYSIGIDLGTTSIKLGVFDLSGKLLASNKCKNPIRYMGKYIELDADECFQIATHQLYRLLQENNIPGNDVACICFSCQGETLLFLDEHFRPLRPAIVWLDNRSVRESRIISSLMDQVTIFSHTGQLEVVPTFPATKIFWCATNERDTFKRTAKICLLADYFVYKLVGELVTDYSLSSSTLYLDIKRLRWWDTMLSTLGITEEQLPKLVSPGTPIATIQREWREALSLRNETIITAGGLDQICSAIAVGNLSVGDVSLNLGTGVGIVTTLSNDALVHPSAIPIHCHVLSNEYAGFAWGQTCGALLDWAEAVLEINGVHKSLHSFSEIIRERARDTQREPLTVLPYFEGAFSPEYDPNAKGVIFGLRLYHDSLDILDAMLDAIAFTVKANLDAVLMSIGNPPKKIPVTGGLTRNESVIQRIADVTAIPLLIYGDEYASARGAALLGFLGTGLIRSLSEVLHSDADQRCVFPQDPDQRRVVSRYERYKGLYEVLRNYFSRESAYQDGLIIPEERDRC